MGIFDFKYLLSKWAINTAALFVVIKTVKGIMVVPGGIEGITTLLLTAAVIGVINAVIKPVIMLLTLPLTIMSLGLFTLLLNGLLFSMAGLIVPGFRVESLWGAIIGALLFSLISFIAGMFIGPGKVRVRNKETKVDYKIIE